MSAVRVTRAFLSWLARHGFSERDLESPPIAWGLIALYEHDREGGDDDD